MSERSLKGSITHTFLFFLLGHIFSIFVVIIEGIVIIERKEKGGYLLKLLEKPRIPIS